MAVRNFYVRADIDGRKTLLAGGPRSKSGGFDLTITQRDNGSIAHAADIIGRVHDDGTLSISIRDKDGNEVLRHRTTR